MEASAALAPAERAHSTHWVGGWVGARVTQSFMELEISLLCSQEPVTGPYPEPD